ncbi:MAG: TRAP transporter large permease [Acidaminococcus provencensis]|jgi:C4-dicarboxylate transporter DctM subunit|uniref:TRAP transporter large permease n=1 Tax=Acidaminococcus provencensis TaxID=2058289 RepID=UPI000CF9E231|nr:TRAP transporter large permease [Acidaminococcus provencensis]MCH4096759.1 TRAP transporter large permease [Acidaminococcus provencensis]
MAAVLVFAVFLIGIALSIPIGVSMILGSVAPIELMHKGGSIVQLLNNTFSGANSTPILAVPLFILGGVIMAKGGISRKLFNFFAYFAGRFTGGLPCAVILTCLFYGAISGSGPATTAAVGAMCVPFLTDLGYDKTWSAGLIAVAGGLGVIIPPSIPFVLYSLATGVSTGDLFLGGVFPGILIGVALMVYAVYYCVKKGEDKDKIKERMSELSSRGLVNLFKDSFWALLCPVIVLGGIYTGFTTPTEAATVSVFYAILVSLFIYKSMKFSELLPMLCESVKTYGGLAFVLAFATAFGRVLSLTRATKVVESFILGNFTSAFSVLTVLTIIFFLLGMVMDTGPAIIILAPILLPACVKLGVDPVHLGVVLVCCLSIGLATPPFGLDLFVAGNIAEKQPMDVAKKAFPFIVSFTIALFMIVYIPWLSTYLPGLLK